MMPIGGSLFGVVLVEKSDGFRFSWFTLPGGLKNSTRETHLFPLKGRLW